VPTDGRNSSIHPSHELVPLDVSAPTTKTAAESLTEEVPIVVLQYPVNKQVKRLLDLTMAK
jgi:hypothetical protein